MAAGVNSYVLTVAREEGYPCEPAPQIPTAFEDELFGLGQVAQFFGVSSCISNV